MAASMPREEIWNSPWALCLHTDQTQRCKPEQFVDDIIQCKTPWYSSLKGSLQTEHYIYLLRLCNINVLKDKTVNKHQDRKRLCRTAPIWSFQPCTYFKSLLLPFYQNSSSWNHSAPSKGGPLSLPCVVFLQFLLQHPDIHLGRGPRGPYTCEVSDVITC